MILALITPLLLSPIAGLTAAEKPIPNIVYIFADAHSLPLFIRCRLI